MRHLLPPDVLYFTTEMPCGCDPRRCVSPPQNRAKNNGIMRWGFRVFNLHLSNPLGQSGSSLFVVGDDISLSLLLQVLCVVGVGLKPHDPLGKKNSGPKLCCWKKFSLWGRPTRCNHLGSSTTTGPSQRTKNLSISLFRWGMNLFGIDWIAGRSWIDWGPPCP